LAEIIPGVADSVAAISERVDQRWDALLRREPPRTRTVRPSRKADSPNLTCATRPRMVARAIADLAIAARRATGAVRGIGPRKATPPIEAARLQVSDQTRAMPRATRQVIRITRIMRIGRRGLVPAVQEQVPVTTVGDTLSTRVRVCQATVPITRIRIAAILALTRHRNAVRRDIRATVDRTIRIADIRNNVLTIRRKVLTVHRSCSVLIARHRGRILRLARRNREVTRRREAIPVLQAHRVRTHRRAVRILHRAVPREEPLHAGAADHRMAAEVGVHVAVGAAATEAGHTVGNLSSHKKKEVLLEPA
jgi:hypothetical protein